MSVPLLVLTWEPPSHVSESSKMDKLKSSPTSLVTELLHLLLHSLTKKDLSVRQLRIRPLLILPELCTMSRDLLEENMETRQFSMTRNIFPTKLLTRKVNHTFKFLKLKEKQKFLPLKKSQLWF